MSDQADQQSDDRIKPWTIKGISPEVRNAAIAAAERARLPIGEWMSRAIRGQVQSDRQESRAPVPVRLEPAPASDPAADLAQLERLVALTTSLAGAGAPPPKAVSRGAYGLIRQRLAEMKDPTETRPGPTRSALSQTELFTGPTGEVSSPTEEVPSPTKPRSSRAEEASGQTKTGPDLTEAVPSPTEGTPSRTKPRSGRTQAGSSQTEGASSPTDEAASPTAMPESPTVASRSKGGRARR